MILSLAALALWSNEEADGILFGNAFIAIALQAAWIAKASCLALSMPLERGLELSAARCGRFLQGELKRNGSVYHERSGRASQVVSTSDTCGEGLRTERSSAVDSKPAAGHAEGECLPPADKHMSPGQLLRWLCSSMAAASVLWSILRLCVRAMRLAFPDASVKRYQVGPCLAQECMLLNRRKTSQRIAKAFLVCAGAAQACKELVWDLRRQAAEWAASRATDPLYRQYRQSGSGGSAFHEQANSPNKQQLSPQELFRASSLPNSSSQRRVPGAANTPDPNADSLPNAAAVAVCVHKFLCGRRSRRWHDAPPPPIELVQLLQTVRNVSSLR